MNKLLVNQISFDIRKILPEVGNKLLPEAIVQNIPVNQYLEKANEINQLNLGGAGKLVHDVSQIIKIDDSNLKAIGLACLGGIHTSNGNYKKAICSINQAFDLRVSEDVYAYTLTEYGNLLRQLKRTDEALAVFENAYQLTKNEDLKWRIKTYKGYCYKYSNKEHALKLLNQASKYYSDNSNYLRFATIQRHIGTIYIHNNEHAEARRIISQVEYVATNYKLDVVQVLIKMDAAWLLVKENNFKEARNIYLGLLSIDIFPYIESLTIQNLGFIEFESGKYTKAIEFFKKSLKINSKYEIYEMLFEDYYKLGLSYEILGNYKNAKKYYTEGYANLLKERQELGIMLISGHRKTLLDNYLRFLTEQPNIEHVKEHTKTFELVKGKTYQEILNIFQKNLLVLHRTIENTIEDLCEALNMSTRSYFVYRKRLNIKKADTIDSNKSNKHFIDYIHSMLGKDWHSVIKEFDNDLYSYMLKIHQYKKTKIAKLLDVSNLTVIKKTAHLN